MAYPDDIYDPREIENMPNVVYDADKKTVLFAEDLNESNAEIVAIEENLGTDDPDVERGKFLRLNCKNGPLSDILKQNGAYWSSFNNFQARNTALVPVSAYPGIIEVGGTNLGTGLLLVRDFLNTAHDYRIRQNGDVSQVKLYINSGEFTDVVLFQIKIWRELPNGEHRLIDVSENVFDQLTPGTTNTVTFEFPLEAREGDFIGWTIMKLGPSDNAEMKADDVVDGDVLAFPSYVEGDVDWSVANVVGSNLAVPIEAYMQAPLLGLVGDSLLDGFIDVGTGNYSFIDNRNKTNLETCPEYLIRRSLEITAQNYALGGSTITSPSPVGKTIRDRWDELAALEVKTIILQGGVNDIIQSRDLEDVLTAYTEMFDDAVAKGIFVFVVSIAPSTDATQEQANIIDAWNLEIKNLANSYDNTCYVDVKLRIGAFRVGGPSGNLQDINPLYDGDGLHLNAVGYGIYSDYILEHMGAAILSGVGKFLGLGVVSGLTLSDSGRIAELASGENIGFFGGSGGVAFFGNNVYRDSNGDYVVRSSASPGNAKISAIALGDGHGAYYCVEGLSDGDVLRIADLVPNQIFGWNKDQVNIYQTNKTAIRVGALEDSGPSSSLIRAGNVYTILGDNITYNGSQFIAGGVASSHIALFGGNIAFYTKAGLTPEDPFVSTLRFKIDSAGVLTFPSFTTAGVVTTAINGVLSAGRAWVGHLISALAPATVTATGGANLHTFPVPAGFWYIGRSVRLSTYGVVSSDATPGNINYRIRIGTTNLCSTGALGMPLNLSNEGWNALVEVTCVNIIGNNAILEVQGQVRLSLPDYTALILSMKNTTTITVANTGTQTFATNIVWDSAGNSITERTFILESLNDLVV